MRRPAGGSVWLVLLPLIACCPAAAASEGEDGSADVVYLLDVSRGMQRADALERGCALIRSHLERLVEPGTRVLLLPFRAKTVEGSRFHFGADLEANGETRRALASRLDALEATGRAGDLSEALEVGSVVSAHVPTPSCPVAARSSRACSRAVGSSSEPASMRAISLTRSSPSRGSTRTRVRRPSVCFSIR